MRTSNDWMKIITFRFLMRIFLVAFLGSLTFSHMSWRENLYRMKKSSKRKKLNFLMQSERGRHWQQPEGKNSLESRFTLIIAVSPHLNQSLSFNAVFHPKAYSHSTYVSTAHLTYSLENPFLFSPRLFPL